MPSECWSRKRPLFSAEALRRIFYFMSKSSRRWELLSAKSWSSRSCRSPTRRRLGRQSEHFKFDAFCNDSSRCSKRPTCTDIAMFDLFKRGLKIDEMDGRIDLFRDLHSLLSFAVERQLTVGGDPDTLTERFLQLFNPVVVFLWRGDPGGLVLLQLAEFFRFQLELPFDALELGRFGRHLLAAITNQKSWAWRILNPAAGRQRWLTFSVRCSSFSVTSFKWSKPSNCHQPKARNHQRRQTKAHQTYPTQQKSNQQQRKDKETNECVKLIRGEREKKEEEGGGQG